MTPARLSLPVCSVIAVYKPILSGACLPWWCHVSRVVSIELVRSLPLYGSQGFPLVLEEVAYSLLRISLCGSRLYTGACIMQALGSHFLFYSWSRWMARLFISFTDHWAGISPICFYR